MNFDRRPVSLSFSAAMAEALRAARAAYQAGEVPVGAVVLSPQGETLAVAHNHVEAGYDASAHAELLAMREAAKKLRSARLIDCSLVVTLEPCPMCVAAISHFRIRRVIYGAYDPKGGGIDHGPCFFAQKGCLYRPDEVISGMQEREAAQLLKAFFQKRR